MSGIMSLALASGGSSSMFDSGFAHLSYVCSSALAELKGLARFPAVRENNPVVSYLDIQLAVSEGAHLDEMSEFAESTKYLDLQTIENLNKLDCMVLFEENWNGTGGLPFTSSAINQFKMIIQKVVKQPDIAPTGRNSLYMQYLLGDKSLLAFEVKENSVEKVFVPKGDYSMAEAETFSDDIVQRINRSVVKFYES